MYSYEVLLLTIFGAEEINHACLVLVQGSMEYISGSIDISKLLRCSREEE